MRDSPYRLRISSKVPILSSTKKIRRLSGCCYSNHSFDHAIEEALNEGKKLNGHNRANGPRDLQSPIHRTQPTPPLSHEVNRAIVRIQSRYCTSKAHFEEASATILEALDFGLENNNVPFTETIYCSSADTPLSQRRHIY